MIDPTSEMRRLAGKFALLFAFVYLLFPFGAVVTTFGGSGPPPIGWLLLVLPAIPFVPSVVAAIRLHRTSDPEQTKALWRRSLVLAVVGMVLLVVVALTLGRMNEP